MPSQGPHKRTLALLVLRQINPLLGVEHVRTCRLYARRQCALTCIALQSGTRLKQPYLCAAQHASRPALSHEDPAIGQLALDDGPVELLGVQLQVRR